VISFGRVELSGAVRAFMLKPAKVLAVAKGTFRQTRYCFSVAGRCVSSTYDLVQAASSSRRIALQRDSTPEDLRVQEPQAGELVAIGKEPTPHPLNGRVDEEPVLVDEPCLNHRVRQRDAPSEHDLPPVFCLSLVTFSTGSPDNTVEFPIGGL
jgi:hypothetical protein